MVEYAEMLFMDFGKPYTSGRLSSLMAEWSAPILGWEMKISDWRHINIAWRRKLCVAAMEALGEDVTSTMHALQSGHTRPTDHRVYGLSPESQLGVPEETLYLFLNVSRDWQKVIRVVPGGLALPYKDSTRGKFDSLVSEGRIQMKNSSTTIGTASDSTVITALSETMRLVSALQKEVVLLRKELQGRQRTILPPTEDAADDERDLVHPPGLVRPRTVSPGMISHFI